MEGVEGGHDGAQNDVRSCLCLLHKPSQFRKLGLGSHREWGILNGVK